MVCPLFCTPSDQAFKSYPNRTSLTGVARSAIFFILLTLGCYKSTHGAWRTASACACKRISPEMNNSVSSTTGNESDKSGQEGGGWETAGRFQGQRIRSPFGKTHISRGSPSAWR